MSAGCVGSWPWVVDRSENWCVLWVGGLTGGLGWMRFELIDFIGKLNGEPIGFMYGLDRLKTNGFHGWMSSEWGKKWVYG